MKIIGGLLIILSILGCSAFQEIQEASKKQESIEKAIKDKHGWESQVSWNMLDGEVTQVTVTFNANDVRNEKVSTLETATLNAAISSFNSKPQAIYIKITLNELTKEN